MLLIAKLDLLTRNVAIIFTLRDSGVEFVCCDMPGANTLTIGVMASMAQYEREVIGERTRKALAEKKRAGHVLGNPENLTLDAVAKGREVRSRNASTITTGGRRLWRLPYDRQGRAELERSGRRLNEAGFRTRRGKALPRRAGSTRTCPV